MEYREDIRPWLAVLSALEAPLCCRAIRRDLWEYLDWRSGAVPVIPRTGLWLSLRGHMLAMASATG